MALLLKYLKRYGQLCAERRFSVADFNYDRWWSLHLRMAKGETLTEQEENEYRLGQQLLDGQPELPDNDTLLHLRTLRTAINRTSVLHADLTNRSAELDRKIAVLEAVYQGLTGYALNVESYASA